MSGWIKIHRSIVDHWLYSEKRTFSKLEAWYDMLLTVNYSDNKTVIKGKLYNIKRGQSILSLESWAKRWGWDKSKVRRFFNTLQSDNMILLKSDTITTHLTICNYDSYQSERNANETQTTRGRNANETQTTLIEEEKRKKEEEKRKKNDLYIKISKSLDYLNFDFPEDAIEIWTNWITYKKEQHKDVYASKTTMQKALDQLCKISKGKTKIAEEIVNNSIASLYKGLFELKNENKNGNNGTKPLNQQERIDESMRKYLEWSQRKTDF
jgi:hypothetical protein